MAEARSTCVPAPPRVPTVATSQSEFLHFSGQGERVDALGDLADIHDINQLKSFRIDD